MSAMVLSVVQVGTAAMFVTVGDGYKGFVKTRRQEMLLVQSQSLQGWDEGDGR